MYTNVPSDIDERRRRTFVFSFEYMTLIGEDCEPLPWQLSDSQKERKVDHIAITRCSAVVGLWLGGPSIATLKNRSRRAKGAAAHTYGYVHDPFGPWQVLNVQCYPDWKSREDVHDSTRHYVNGVEAFVVSLLGEFVDAEVRFEAILHQITTLVTPPLDFMFNADVRERLLFEDAAFTYVRRYFWAMQTLGIIKNSIKAMVDAYEDNFTDEVWTGNHKTLWPLQEENRPRNVHFRKKMSTLRTRFDQQVVKLKNLIGEIDDRRAEIQNLREELFVGTSIQESRKSVENSDITVQQGHNIKILTMVSIFFLPLTFVTSVFGMTNSTGLPSLHRHFRSLSRSDSLTFWKICSANGRTLLAVRNCDCVCLCPILHPGWITQYHPRPPFLAPQGSHRCSESFWLDLQARSPGV